LTIPSLSANATESALQNSIFRKNLKIDERTYWDRTDRFDEKLDLLQSAWDKGDYRLARSLCDSLRISGIQAQVDQQDPETTISASSNFEMVSNLAPEWRKWDEGWKYFMVINAKSISKIKRTISSEAEMLGYPVNYIPSSEFRSQVAIDICLGFRADQVI